MPTTPETQAPNRVKVYFTAPVDHRNWFKAAAALEGMGLDEWLYVMAVRRAEELGVPQPFRRSAD